MTDDLDRLLAPPIAPSPPERRDRLRQQTTRVIRRRRITRWGGRVVALAACYVAGLGTVAMMRTPPRVEIVERVIEVPVAAPVSSPAPLPESPRSLELAAEQADAAESARLFIEAGRRYGRDWNDWTSALRCYRNALDMLGDTPPPTPGDDWLLVKLKTERRENHVQLNP